MLLRIRPTLFALIAVACAQGAGAQVMNAGSMLGQDVVHRIPFPRTDREIMDTARIRGRAYTFLLDTGAPLCISAAMQAREHFPVVQTARLTDANGRADSTLIVCVDTVRIGTLTFCGIPAVVLDLAHSPLGKEGVEGIIGGNVLRFLLVRFDAAKHEILLADRPSAAGLDTAMTWPGELDEQSNFRMPLGIGDCSTDTVEVDSGMGDAFVMNVQTTERMQVSCPEEAVHRMPARKGRTAGMLGRDRTPVGRFRATTLTLGGATLSSELDFTGTGGASRIGRALIARGVLILDYPRARYSFVANGGK